MKSISLYAVGTLFNFNTEAYERSEDFEKLIKEKLKHADLVYADETGINIEGYIKIYGCKLCTIYKQSRWE